MWQGKYARMRKFCMFFFLICIIILQFLSDIHLCTYYSSCMESFLILIRKLLSVALLKRPSHGKLKLANSCWQTQVGVCERHKNNRQTRFYLTPTVCKGVCRLFSCRLRTPTWVCQHEFANSSLPCEGRFTHIVFSF